MKERISIDPTIHFGKPCIIGTSITVTSIWELVEEGISAEEIIHEFYPNIDQDDILACINYVKEKNDYNTIL